MIEMSARKKPAGETLFRLATLYGTTVEYLLTGAGDQPTEESVRRAVGLLEPASEVAGDPAPTFPDPASATGTHGAG
jgi:hypothetical protein